MSAGHALGLPGWAAFGLVLLSLGGLEAAVRFGYTPPGELLPKVAAVKAALDPEKPDALLFGTCIGTQSVDQGLLQDSMGAAARVHDLTAPGAFPMDWYLTLRTLLDPAQVDLILIVFTPGDLSGSSETWQAQTYDLMDLTSIREVAYWSCTDSACVTELYLRKFSLLYRDRAYLANRVWTGVGAREGAQPERPAGEPYSARADAESEGPWHFVRRIIELAKVRGTPLEFVELPLNSEIGNPAEWAKHERIRGETESRLGMFGAKLTVLRPPREGGYEDLVHFSKAGRKDITEQLVTTLRARGELKP